MVSFLRIPAQAGPGLSVSPPQPYLPQPLPAGPHSQSFRSCSLSRVCELASEWRFSKLQVFKLLSPAAAAAASLQSCPTLCDPRDSSPPGSPVPGILQARTLEWGAISFSAEGWPVLIATQVGLPDF